MSIQNYLNKIKDAVFGKDIREAIYASIKQCYDDAAVNHDNANMEVKFARGSHHTLNDRLTEHEKNQKEINEQLDTIDQEKANEKDVRKKNELLTMMDMGQDVKTAMTGGSVAVVGEGAVGLDNLANDTKYLLNNIKNNGYVIETYTKNNLIQQELIITDGKNYGQWNTDGSIDSTMTQYKPLRYIVDGANFIFIEYASLRFSSNKAGFLWKDVRENVISYDNSSKLYENIGIEVPSNAYYLCLSQPYDDYINTKIYTTLKRTRTTLEDFEKINDEINRLNEKQYYFKQDNYINFIDKKSPCLVLNDGIETTVGVTTLCATYDVTGIEKIKFEKLVAGYSSNSKFATYVFLDNSNKVLSYSNKYNTTVENIEVDVPIGSTRLKVNIAGMLDPNVSHTKIIKYNKIAIKDTAASIDETLSNLEEKINEKINDEINRLNEKQYYFKQDNYINFIDKKSPCLVLNDGIETTVGVTTLCATYDVTGIEKIKFEKLVAGYSSNSKFATYVFLDNSNKVLSYSNKYNTTVENIEVDVPIGSTRLKVNISATLDGNVSHTKIIKYNKIAIKDTVASIDETLSNLENDMYNVIENSLDGVYDNFSSKSDITDIRGSKLFSGHTWSVTGSEASSVSIKNGELTNIVGNFYMFVPIKNPKFMSMKFSFKRKDEVIQNPSGSPLCVIIYEGQKNDLLEFIHLTFSRNSVDVSTRNNTEEFLRNFTVLYGNYSYETLQDNVVYEVKTWLEGNILYIIKPDGNLFILQSDDFVKEIAYAKWQITSANQAQHKGYLHEVCAGIKNASSVFRMAQKMKKILT